jgi:excisionase family DNA binding protein
MPEWLTISQAGAYLKVGRATLYRWVSQGRLRSYGLDGGGRRFKREDLDGMLSPTPFESWLSHVVVNLSQHWPSGDRQERFDESIETTLESRRYFGPLVTWSESDRVLHVTLITAGDKEGAAQLARNIVMRHLSLAAHVAPQRALEAVTSVLEIRPFLLPEGWVGTECVHFASPGSIVTQCGLGTGQMQPQSTWMSLAWQSACEPCLRTMSAHERRYVERQFGHGRGLRLPQLARPKAAAQ